jgi:hypothetical protein
MKNLILILFGFLTVSIIISCKKSTQKPTSPSISGTWNLVSDASFSVPYNPGGINTPGPPVQNFDFQAGGRLSWAAHAFSCDSASYTLQSTNMVMITFYPKTALYYQGINSYRILQLTANKMVLSLIQSTAPGTILGATMVFSR